MTAFSRWASVSLTAVAAGAVLAAVGAAPAAADAITYTDGGNVWIASPDGSVKRQLTTDATADVKYFGPSQADNGKIAALFGGGLSKLSNPQMVVLTSTGARETTGLLPLQTCGAFGSTPSSFGTTRIDPQGEVIAYDYLCTNYGQGTAGTEVYTALTSSTNPGGVYQELRAVGGYRPSWLNRGGPPAPDILGTDQYGRWLGTLTWQLPLEWTPLIWPVDGVTFGGASFSRSGNILAFEASRDDRTELYVARLSGDMSPGTTVLAECLLASAGPDVAMTPSVSPDGSKVAWSDPQGAKVATVTVPDGPGKTCQESSITLSASGIDPVFSGASAPAPGPNPNPNPTPTPTPTPTLKVKGPTSVTRAQLKKGVSYSTRCAAKCTVKGSLRAGSRLVATDTTKLRRKGTAKVVLRANLKKSVKTVTAVITSGGKSATRVLPVRG